VRTDPNAYGRAIDEYLMFYAAGVDGLFSDNSDTAVVARRLFSPAVTVHSASITSVKPPVAKATAANLSTRRFSIVVELIEMCASSRAIAMSITTAQQ
jgi:hypothetical protein